MFTATDIEIMLKALLAGFLGFLIGWERERCGSPAGDRTFALVAVGGAVVTALALELFPSSADRVVAGAVTGIGFLGAGMIMRRDSGEIRGLTTAAGLWAVNIMGVVIGSGRYLLGVFVAALVLLLLIWEQLPIPRQLRIGSRQGNVAEGDETHPQQ